MQPFSLKGRRLISNLLFFHKIDKKAIKSSMEKMLILDMSNFCDIWRRNYFFRVFRCFCLWQLSLSNAGKISYHGNYCVIGTFGILRKKMCKKVAIRKMNCAVFYLFSFVSWLNILPRHFFYVQNIDWSYRYINFSSATTTLLNFSL